ncbi:MAG: hypothetical protein KatS3mg002_1471 [Candidatus Woesearchaeota archaeon]|nr:MAG: hypothetical protein KatS3mg002_1471 [Candidatus Woesearchaeota archaeon]GIW23330.1 MAG: hypothetical protein KatS3mg068_2337 [Candidatus Sericytochromatia bacterium]GIX42979.1 MAG: hypothetical protein KatS3mg129_2712 [Leptospiraceae bacterium]
MESVKQRLKSILGFALIEKFKYFRHLRNKPVKILDVGCGNRSPSKTKKFFPLCEYHCIDKEFYNLADEDFKVMDKFFNKDLEKDLLEDIQDNYYDIVIMSHVIEHIKNGLEVLDKISQKVKSGGYIYIEFPDINSFNLPSMKGTLHFCDDETHIRCYAPHEIINILLDNDFKIIFSRTRRNMYRILLMPFLITYHYIRQVPIAGDFWDITGFAYQILAQKKDREKYC